MWVVPFSFVHARTWFLFPSRKTSSEDELRNVRPTVVFGNSDVVLNWPGRTWYERTAASSDGFEVMLGCAPAPVICPRRIIQRIEHHVRKPSASRLI